MSNTNSSLALKRRVFLEVIYKIVFLYSNKLCRGEYKTTENHNSQGIRKNKGKLIK